MEKETQCHLTQKERESLGAKFLHLKNIGHSEGRLTIAYWPCNGHSVWVGLAWCSPHENFSRKRGRMIAVGRMWNHKTTITMRMKTNLEKITGAIILTALEKYLVEHQSSFDDRSRCPSWAKEWVEAIRRRTRQQT
jgi:hypothetical protein